MSELVIKTALENGDLPKKKYSKKELKKMSKVLKPLENILNEHYTKHIMSKYGDIYDNILNQLAVREISWIREKISLEYSKHLKKGYRCIT